MAYFSSLERVLRVAIHCDTSFHKWFGPTRHWLVLGSLIFIHNLQGFGDGLKFEFCFLPFTGCNGCLDNSSSAVGQSGFVFDEGRSNADAKDAITISIEPPDGAAKPRPGDARDARRQGGIRELTPWRSRGTGAAGAAGAPRGSG